MAKHKVIFAAAFAVIVFVGSYLFFLEDDKKGVVVFVEAYINAVKNEDFKTAYNLNAASQKRSLFVLKGTDSNKDEILKQIYEEQKTIFVSVQNRFVPNALWTEKALFIKGMKYKINKVTMGLDVDNPTAFYRKRINATADIEAEYNNKETAPVFEGGSIKKTDMIVKMVHSKNIGKTLKSMSGIEDDKWLFKGVAIKYGSIVYW